MIIILKRNSIISICNVLKYSIKFKFDNPFDSHYFDRNI